MTVAERLMRLGANLLAVDPYLDAGQVPEGLTLVQCTDEYLGSADLIVVLTAHDALDWDAVERHASRVFDTRNRLTSHVADRLRLHLQHAPARRRTAHSTAVAAADRPLAGPGLGDRHR
jgi:UDP-N-acetyl-D-mannosaminuronate dehydrogenase